MTRFAARLALLTAVDAASHMGSDGQQPGAAQQPAAAFAAGGSGRRLLQTMATDAVGTGNPNQTIPSTAAVVAGVVGGLSTLTLCLAVALMFAVASIYGVRWTMCGRGRRGRRPRSRTGGAGNGGDESPPGVKKSDVDLVLEMGRANTRLPSIVTSHLEPHPSDSTLYEQPSSNRIATSKTVTPMSSGGTVRSPLKSDASWKDCLIEPEQIQILRRRDGKPWVLGGGAFGQVYKALYDGVQVVAAKVLTGLNDERVLDSFVREAAILRDMRDRNIVQFVGVCMGSEEEGQPDEAMMIQEFMEAGDLYKALKWRDEAGRRVFGWYARGKRAACDIARGLHYLHSHKTVHLDVKSSNVLLARDGACKLADVGLARSLLTKNYLTHAGTLGTFAWSAPEVLTGQQCTVSADIYSFGIVLWEITTGEVPTRGAMRNPKVPEECPQAVVDLMDRCLETVPSQRPTAKEIVLLLESMPAGTPSQAEARGAPLRATSLAQWRDLLPQQISKLSLPGSSKAGEEEGEQGEGLGYDPAVDTFRSGLSNDAEEIAAAQQLAEANPQGGACAAATMRLEDLPPLSASERLF